MFWAWILYSSKKEKKKNLLFVHLRSLSLFFKINPGSFILVVRAIISGITYLGSPFSAWSKSRGAYLSLWHQWKECLMYDFSCFSDLHFLLEHIPHFTWSPMFAALVSAKIYLILHSILASPGPTLYILLSPTRKLFTADFLIPIGNLIMSGCSLSTKCAKKCWYHAECEKRFEFPGMHPTEKDKILLFHCLLSLPLPRNTVVEGFLPSLFIWQELQTNSKMNRSFFLLGEIKEKSYYNINSRIKKMRM